MASDLKEEIVELVTQGDCAEHAALLGDPPVRAVHPNCGQFPLVVSFMVQSGHEGSKTINRIDDVVVDEAGAVLVLARPLSMGFMPFFIEGDAGLSEFGQVK